MRMVKFEKVKVQDEDERGPERKRRASGSRELVIETDRDGGKSTAEFSTLSLV